MPAISLNAASAVTGLNKRTRWRHIQDGRVSTIREAAGG